MLDELLGRAELKERIADLEAENEHLERQLEAEQERRRDAKSARQEAEERVNRLEDRIADLEGRLEHAGSADAAEIEFRRREELRGERATAVLDRLRSVETGPEGALTATVDGEVPDPVRETFGERTTLVERAAPCLAYADDAGLVSVALRPPVAPDPFCEWADGFRVEESWFRPTGRFAFALVRSDLFALGVYEGRERVTLRGFRTDVKSNHSKGGFSQARFERLREGQIRDHLDRCHEVLGDAEADRTIVVGEGTLLGEFDADATASVDATGEPEDALDRAFRDFWTVRLYGI